MVTVPERALWRCALIKVLAMSVTRSVTKSLSSFQWPWQYDFKPFYTIQPNLDTRTKQLEAWCELVLAYHQHTKAYVMDVNEALSSELFYNAKINRILSHL